MIDAIKEKVGKNKEMVWHEPGSDKWYVRFTDDEMDELIWKSESLVECYGLNRKIGNYKA